MAEEPDRQEVLTALTTEHFTLQGARSQTISESGTRASLYVFSVSSTLVGLGFIAQVSEVGDVFDVFALTVLPTLYVLGVFTFVRLVETSVENILYGRAINRIRSYYLQRAGTESRWFVLGGYDDPLGVIRNMGIKPNRMQLYFTSAMMIAVINSVVGGSAVAIAAGAIADPPLGVAVGAGAVAAIASLFALSRLDQRMHDEGSVEIEPMFPSPDAAP